MKINYIEVFAQMSHKAEFVVVRHLHIMTTRGKVRDFVLFAGLKIDMFVPF